MPRCHLKGAVIRENIHIGKFFDIKSQIEKKRVLSTKKGFGPYYYDGDNDGDDGNDDDEEPPRTQW